MDVTFSTVNYLRTEGLLPRAQMMPTRTCTPCLVPCDTSTSMIASMVGGVGHTCLPVKSSPGRGSHFVSYAAQGN